MINESNGRPGNPGDTDYSQFPRSFSELNKQLASGRGRWFFTLLAGVSIGLFVYSNLSDEEPVIYFPVMIRGAAVWWILLSALILWAGLAILNWISWYRKK
jgi:hypothetical protein